MLPPLPPDRLPFASSQAPPDTLKSSELPMFSTHEVRLMAPPWVDIADSGRPVLSSSGWVVLLSLVHRPDTSRVTSSARFTEAEDATVILPPLLAMSASMLMPPSE